MCSEIVHNTPQHPHTHTFGVALCGEMKGLAVSLVAAAVPSAKEVLSEGEGEGEEEEGGALVRSLLPMASC